MNDRLQKLASEADLMRYPSDGINIRIEKFALLIVQECADLVKDFYREDEFTCYSAETEIRKHFGVEE